MTFIPYKTTKATGIAWLGEVPTHWEIVPFKHVLDRVESGTSVNAVDTPAAEGERGVLKTSCVYSGDFDPAENKAILVEEYERASCPLRAGCLIVSRMNTPDLVGAAGLVKNEVQGLFLPDRLWQLHFTDVEPTFVHYWTRTLAYRSQVQMACSGTSSSMQNLAQDQLRSFWFLRPSRSEQVTIVRFLDRETAKIDALVSEQQRLIELLKEKRQAVISHAVTKGLGPDVPMKDCDVEWLGEVPENWEAASLKRLCLKITDGAHISPETEGGIYCFVSTKDVTERGIDFDCCLRTSAASYEYLVRTGCRPLVGDVLFSKDGTIGRTVVVVHEREFVVASSLIIIRPDKDRLDPIFLHYLCQSALVRCQVESYVKGAGLPRLSIQNLLRVIGAFPPVHEQAKITAYLDVLVGKFDTLVAEAENAIDLLQERRSALISAAVTGKIDVRGLVEADAPIPDVIAA